MTAMLAARVIEKTGASVSAVASLEELRPLPQLSATDVCVVDANAASAADLKAIRGLMPAARLILLTGEAGRGGHDVADVVLSSPLKPADLRVALG